MNTRPLYAITADQKNGVIPWIGLLLVLKTLAWPVAVLVIVILLKKPIKDLIPALKKLRYKEFELDFNKELEEVERKADEAQLPQTTEVIKNPELLNNPNTLERMNYIKDLNLNSSRGGIIDSWLLVEEALRNLAEQHSLRSINMAPVQILRELFQKNIITHDVFEICDTLRKIRNEAVHSNNFSASPSESNEFINMSFRVLASLNNLLNERETA
ncbi:hypothetical protein [Fontibacillus sp. BL9]|uniref:hypothetical protein n=1 Tax=Fontibacillus sp. BL9 TaxID=3389971 RepID=UPI003979424B